MIVFEFLAALLQFILNLLLAICMIPFIPIVWVIREIKGVKPVVKEPYMNLPKMKMTVTKKDKRSDYEEDEGRL